MKKILVINAGSSSIKWSLFNDKLALEAKGVAQKIKLPLGILTLEYQNQKHEIELPLPSFLEAVKKLVEQWEEYHIIKDFSEISQVAFRIVNGGPNLQDTCEVNEKTIAYFKEVLDLAPVHNPGALETILAFEKLFPQAKKTMHFDTSFHRTLPRVAYTYPIDYEITKKYYIRKYGFHGLNHHYIAKKSEEIFGHKDVNIVSLHIGNGASLCAIENGKSIDTSMGFTPLDGVMMGTRCGEIDPSIIPYIAKHSGMQLDEIMKMLNEKSGMLGVSQISPDIRDIHKVKSINPQAQFALDLYVEKITNYLIKYLNKIHGKIDGIVFTAGVGENDSYVRSQVIKKINLLKLEIDEEINKDRSYSDYKLISTKNSALPIYMVRANEEQFIVTEAKNFFDAKK
ncbi:acetate kinase [Metamycoplasma arthritidis]|uniref:Acetate kinase n=1 Tax=Metamycoplasma arthritidis (strain 158L3-1) TaxID=243272 RepID=B3PN50_META1|nr:acetate/propionate family kinase [Metamycoplasma arthritidis]ACF07452.1 acetate kinase [Metamycoplasma arthritidis 158L3-1]VEU78973.1 acetate kinase [Metamycoplasma arthritidis]